MLNVDDSCRTTLNVKYHNDFARNWGFVAGYLNERLRFSDFNQDGLQLAPVKGTPGNVGSSTGLITMNTLVQPFNVDAFYTTLTYKF